MVYDFPEIQTIRMFKHLTEDELKPLLAKCDIVEYLEGEIIVSQGDESLYLYAVLSGKMNVKVKGHQENVPVDIITIGEVFGEAAIFTGEKRTATVTAAEKTVVLRVKRGDIIHFIANSPKAGNKMLVYIILRLLRRLKGANKTIAVTREPEMADMDVLLKNFLDVM